MTRPVTIVDAPARLVQSVDWFIAVFAWDYGDPKGLAALIRRGEPIPPEYVNAVADVVTGRRRANRKPFARCPLPVELVILRAIEFDVKVGQLDKAQHDAIDDEMPGARGSTVLADKFRVEPIVIIKAIRAGRQKALADAASTLGIPESTIVDATRKLRARIKRWPVI